MAFDPESTNTDCGLAAPSQDAIVWLASYALGIRDTAYGIETDSGQRLAHWRFLVDDTETTVSISTFGQNDYPDILLQSAWSLGHLDDSSHVQSFEKFELYNRSFSGKKPQYCSRSWVSGILLNGEIAPYLKSSTPKEERIRVLSIAGRKGKKATDAVFRDILEIPKSSDLTVGKWKAIRHCLQEAIEYGRAESIRQ